MELFLFSQPDFFEGEADLITELLSPGALTFHLRKPSSNLSELEILLNKIPSGLHQHIVVHQHHQLVQHFKFKGIHFPEKNRETILKAGIENLIQQNAPLTVSTSFHDLLTLKNLNHFFSYVFFSPVFESISKPGYYPGITLLEMGNIIRQLKIYNPQLRIVALGGVNEQNLPFVKKEGFTGSAFLGTVWNDPDPVRKMEELKQQAAQL